MNFSECLKQRRHELGLTQQQVAAEIGVDNTTYAHYESGRRTPDLHKLRDLCDFLSISFEDQFPIIRTIKFPPERVQKLTDTIQYVSEQLSEMKEQESALIPADRWKRVGELIDILTRDTEPLLTEWENTMDIPKTDLPAPGEEQTILRIKYRNEDWLLLSKSLSLQSELYRFFFSQNEQSGLG